MIVDDMNNISSYLSVSKRMTQALNFIQNNDLLKLSPGKHEIDGANLYAIVISEHGHKKDEVKLEIHKRYLDIQIVLNGNELMGWKPTVMCKSPVSEYNSEKDIQFFYDPIDVWLSVSAGWFAIFLPQDAHAPMVSPSTVHKVIVKVLL